MIHQMRLHARPFAEIKNGEKTSEFRVNDKKRQLIKIGDLIEFASRDNLNEKLTVEVIYLKTYPTFRDLFRKLKNPRPNWKEAGFLESMQRYYAPGEEEKYGVLEIEFKLLAS
jgi:ASC-1-like (ASCH) protein